jgi:hypothetical protein
MTERTALRGRTARRAVHVHERTAEGAATRVEVASREPLPSAPLARDEQVRREACAEVDRIPQLPQAPFTGPLAGRADRARSAAFVAIDEDPPGYST